MKWQMKSAWSFNKEFLFLATPWWFLLSSHMPWWCGQAPGCFIRHWPFRQHGQKVKSCFPHCQSSNIKSKKNQGGEKRELNGKRIQQLSFSAKHSKTVNYRARWLYSSCTLLCHRDRLVTAYIQLIFLIYSIQKLRSFRLWQSDSSITLSYSAVF